jgi:hypothetical protein
MKPREPYLAKCATCGTDGAYASRWRYVGDDPPVRVSLYARCGRDGPACFIAQAEDEHAVAKKWNREQRKIRRAEKEKP